MEDRDQVENTWRLGGENTGFCLGDIDNNGDFYTEAAAGMHYMVPSQVGGNPSLFYHPTEIWTYCSSLPKQKWKVNQRADGSSSSETLLNLHFKVKLC